VLTCNIVKVIIKKIRYKNINKRVAKIYREVSKILIYSKINVIDLYIFNKLEKDFFIVILKDLKFK